MNKKVKGWAWLRLAGAMLITASGVLVMGGCRPMAGGASDQGIMADGLSGYPGQSLGKTRDYMSDEVTFGTMDSPDNSPLPVVIPCATCPGGRITLLLAAEEDADRVSWANALSEGQKGSVVAMIKNVDTVSYSYLKLAPGDVAYQWVGQIDAAKRGVAWFKIDRSSGRATPLAWTPRAVKCTDPNPAPALRKKPTVKYKPTHDDSWNCQPITALSAARSAQSGLSLTRVASLLVTSAYAAIEPRAAVNFGALDDVWVDCPAGCCEPNGMMEYN